MTMIENYLFPVQSVICILKQLRFQLLVHLISETDQRHLLIPRCNKKGVVTKIETNCHNYRHSPLHANLSNPLSVHVQKSFCTYLQCTHPESNVLFTCLSLSTRIC